MKVLVGAFLLLSFQLSSFAAECTTLLENPLRVGLSNYELEGGQSLNAYLGKIERQIRHDAAADSRLVLLPELTSLDLLDFSRGDTSIRQQLREIARTSTPQIVAHLQRLARELNVHLVLGGTPRVLRNRIYNSAVFATPNGEIHYQDKIYLTPDEIAWGWTAGNELKVFSTPIGKLVILICYDSEFPSLSALLSAQTPEIILVPSMTDAKGFIRVRWSAQARAVEHKAFVLMNGITGAPAPGWEMHAEAAALSPADSHFPGIIAAGNANFSAQLDLNLLRESRRLNEPYPAADEIKYAKSVTVTQVRIEERP